VAIPIAVAPADATHTSHHASEDRIDQSEKVFDRDTSRRHIGDAVSRSFGLTGAERCMDAGRLGFPPEPGARRRAGMRLALRQSDAGVEDRGAPDYTSNR
jgi:hypothetical protein